MSSKKRFYLNHAQQRYARQAYEQIITKGVALIQLPTGQGKTLIALKVIAEILSHSKRPRHIVLVTRKLENEALFRKALRGETLSKKEYLNHPWLRDAYRAGGLSRLHKGSSPKIGPIECRSIMNQVESFPAGAIVIIDEVHRFQSFTKRMAKGAYTEKPGPMCSGARKRKFLLLSATPINPTRITSKEEKGVISFEEEEKLEDTRIKSSYLYLYKAMIGMSSLSRSKKDDLLQILDNGHLKNIDDFALDLHTVMKVLKPIPSPKDLLRLGPKGQIPKCPKSNTKSPEYYKPSIIGLLKYHESIAKKTSLYYCAERMALAGAKAKRGTSTVGFEKQPKVFAKRGLFHYQPNAPYMDQTLRALRVLENNKKEIRRLLNLKIESLYNYLLDIWRERSGKPKWKVLIYCAHRGTVGSLAAELEKRFYKDNIVCECHYVQSELYGEKGKRRIVWDTEGYSIAEKSESEQEDTLKRKFCSVNRIKPCGGNKSRCPRGFLLVTSDRLSESIDLHNVCETMIHYDLDWSPLRMIQRYGRLWRLEKPEKRPKPPAVFHMVQPGSVDDEILWRLEKRWEKLRKLNLGLELVDIKHALGKRIY